MLRSRNNSYVVGLSLVPHHDRRIQTEGDLEDMRGIFDAIYSRIQTRRRLNILRRRNSSYVVGLSLVPHRDRRIQTEVFWKM